MSRMKLQNNSVIDYHFDVNLTHLAIEKGKRLFLDGHLYETVTDNGVGRYVLFNPDRFNALIDILSDNGMIYLSYPESIVSVWEEAFQHSQLGLPNWILQNATLWRISVFSSSEEYLTFLRHLAFCYSQHTAPALENYRQEDNEKSIAIDEDHYQRLPTFQDYLEMLYSNPWFVFLLTVHCSYPEIYRNMQHYQIVIAASSTSNETE